MRQFLPLRSEEYMAPLRDQMLAEERSRAKAERGRFLASLLVWSPATVVFTAVFWQLLQRMPAIQQLLHDAFRGFR